MQISSIIDAASGMLPDNLNLQEVLSSAASLLPMQIDLASTLKFVLIFFAGSIMAGALGRVVFGKRSGLNHALSSRLRCKRWSSGPYLREQR